MGEEFEGEVCILCCEEGGGEADRIMGDRLDLRTKAMEGMPKLIEKWRKLGHGRGWKDWPR